MSLLYPFEPQDGIGGIIAWLSGIGEVPGVGTIDENNVGPDRVAGDPLPYFMVRRPTVDDDKITEYGVYVVHAFATAESPRVALLAAYRLAMIGHRRMLAMGPPFAGQQRIVLPDSSVVQCDGVDTKEGPTWVPYSDSDKTIQQYVTEYDIPWRYVAST